MQTCAKPNLRKGEYGEIIVSVGIRPLGPVTVRPKCGRNNKCVKLVFNPSSVTINPDDFKVPKRIRVSFKEGAVGDEKVKMVFTGGGYGNDFQSETYRFIEDPKVNLILSENPIDEGESTKVTATLNKVSNKKTTVTISAMHGLNATEDDYALSDNKILTIVKGKKISTGDVTITAIDSA